MTTFLSPKQLVFFILLCVSINGSAQEWMYLKGTTSGAPGQYGVYGTQGVAASANLPGSRAYGITWADNSGGLWLFGGGGWGSTGQSVAGLSDVWKYDIASNQWTWVKGPSAPDQVGVYGTQGVAAAANNPGGRQLFQSWTDHSGNFWVYGGYGWDASSGGTLNDLWKYDPLANNWTWMHGSNAANAVPVYGTQGTAAAANTPGARSNAMTWTDNSGDLWLFGGTGPGLMGVSYNDLWKYTSTTNQWTWVNGTMLTNQNGTYGTQGLAASGNVPGGRTQATTWTDNAGNLWLFGGSGYAATGSTGSLNDLWKYDITANTWTWIKGSNAINAAGVYGSQGLSATANVPGSRSEGTRSWKDTNGNLWLFGGQGYATSTLGKLNDVWKYTIATNEWTWIKGSNTLNQLGVYGTAGVSAASNVAGARTGFLSWCDNAGNFWILGGVGYNSTNTGYMNDLWRFTTCNAIPAAAVNSSSSFNQNICSGHSTTLVVTSASPVNWYASPTSTTVLGSGTTFTTTPPAIGNYTFYAEAYGCQPSSYRTPIQVVVNALPSISVSGGTLCSGSVFTLAPSGAANYTYSGGSATVMPLQNASYSVTGTSTAGCAATNTAVASITVITTPTVALSNTAICAGGSVTLAPSGALTYTYSSGSAVVSPGSTSAYTVTGSAQGCVSLPLVVVVQVNALPTLSVTQRAAICKGERAVIYIHGAASYIWNTGSLTDSIAVSPSSTTQYTVTGTSAAGCNKTTTITLVVAECTGIKSVSQTESQLMIFPNPNNGTFTIRAKEKVHLMLVNELGQLIRNFETTEPDEIIITNLNAGIYFITGTGDSGQVKQKIIVAD